jgi:hypothetical protein
MRFWPLTLSLRFRVRPLLLFCLLFTLPLRSQPPASHPVRTILLWNEQTTRSDSLDQQAFEIMLESIGFHPLRLRPNLLLHTALDSNTLLVVPRASAAICTPADAAYIVRYLQDGLSLIADGKSPLTRALGLRLGTPATVSRIRDRSRSDLYIFWHDRPSVPWIAGAPKPWPTPVYTDRATGRSLAIVLQIGKGRCLYLAPLFDPRSGRGYGRFATLPEVIVQNLRRAPSLIRRGADTYFDAGYRTGESPDSLAELWRRRGVRAIHAAAWYTYEEPPYDYSGLIDACHRRGILVYAWLEWPYIGRGFWDDHPEWRQKNALLKDAHFDFLYLMDLQNPACMEWALKDLDSLLTLDWDGVDVAEFTLTGAGKQGLLGPSRPDWFTGFTDYCRAEFKSEKGFDPLDFFDRRSPHFWQMDSAGLEAFYRYRTRVNTSTQHRLFTELERMNRERKRSWEFVLTIVDNSLHPEFDNLLGFDMGRTIGLLREFDITLQVEDPYLEWMRPPERYVAVGETYRRLLGGRPFIIDVNVVPMKPDRWRDFSTWQPVGTEVFQFWKYAAAQSDRVCFYCESSVSEKDWEFLPFAMAGGSSVSCDSTGWTVDGPSTVLLRGIPHPEGVLIDGQEWPAGDSSGIIIPAGRHRVDQAKRRCTGGASKLLSINGELVSAKRDGDGLSVEYESRPRCILRFSFRPGQVMIDGIPAVLSLYHDGDGCAIVAPPGRHTLTVSMK